GRLLRTVLWEPGGEIPPGYPTPGSGRRGVRFPRLPSPVGARPGHSQPQPGLFPCPLALAQGGPARPRPDPASHRPEAAVECRRMGRAGSQSVPARLGRLLPVWELRPHVRRDQPVRPGTAGRVRGQAPQTKPPLGDEAGDLRVTGQPRADHLVRNRHRPQALPALAGHGRTPTVENVGRPRAGQPPARFDGEGLETEPRPPRQPFTLRPVELRVSCANVAFYASGPVGVLPTSG